MKRLATCLSAACLVIGATIGSVTSLAQVSSSATAEAATLNGQHPAEYYNRAAKLFGEGKRDDAVFMFYLGQLRYRTHLSARGAQLKPDGDPALFSSLSEVVGRPLNEYAFGDIPALVRIIDAVLAYVWTKDNFGPVDWLPASSIDPVIIALLPGHPEPLTPKAVSAMVKWFGKHGRYPAVNMMTGEVGA